MNHTPLVSVVTPTYNRPNHLIKAVKAVDNQTYRNIEHIIVDDYSTISITNILDEYDYDIDLTLYRHKKNQGANAARNTGISLANGEYIAFLDDDDNWKPEKIEKQITRAVETDAGVVYTGVNQLDDMGTFATQIPSIEGDTVLETLTNNPVGSFSTILVHTDVFESIGHLDNQLPNWQDWEFYIRAAQITDFAAVTEPLVDRYHHDEGQISSNYEQKRDVSVPLIRKKHSNLATEYGVEDEFEARIQRALGATAIEAGQYQEARKHYLRAVKYSPSKQDIGRLSALVGGKFTYRSAQKARRSLARHIA